MVIVVTGDRYWAFYDIILETLRAYPPDTVIVEGGARGADTFARLAAQKLGLECRTYPAQWQVYGRSAGPIRNRAMLELERPDLVLAFHNHLQQSKGTKDMLRQALRRGVPVLLVGSDGTHTTHTKLTKIGGVA